MNIKKRHRLSWIGMGILLLVMGETGAAWQRQCPTLSGYEDFGPLNQGPHDVALSGHHAFTADLHGLTAYDITDPAHPAKVGDVLLPGPGKGIAVAGSLALVADWKSGLQIIDISDPAHPQLAGTYHIRGLAMDVVASGHAAYVVNSTGLRIIDVSDPSNPSLLGTFNTSGSAYGIAVAGTLAYVADYAAGLQIIDVSNPASPRLLGTCDTPGSAWGVAVWGNTAYVTDYTKGLALIDVTDPASPQLIRSYATSNFAFGVAASGGRAYVAVDGRGLEIVDVSDPANPVSEAIFDTPGHAWNVAISENTVFVADETSLQILDVTDPTDPRLEGAFDSPGNAWRLTISGSLAYVPDRDAGLRILDVSDPLAPTELGGCELEGTAWNAAVSEDLAFVAAWAGLEIVDVSNPASPHSLGLLRTPSTARGIAVSGHTAYVAAWSSGLQIVDVSDPSTPEIIGSCDTPGKAINVTLAGHTAFVSDHRSGLQIIDVSDPSAPQLVGSYEAPDYIMDAAISGHVAYLANGNIGLEIIDVSDPSHPYSLASLPIRGFCFDVASSGNLVFLATDVGGLQIVDVSDPSVPVLVSSMITRHQPHGLALDPATGTVWLASEAIVEGVQVGCLTAGCPTLQVVAQPGSVTAKGSPSTLTVTVTDSSGDPVTGATLKPATTSGTVSAFTGHGDGTYTATFTPGSTVGWASVRVYLDGTACSGSTAIHVTFPAEPSLSGPLPTHRLAIPAAAHVSGAQGTAWRSDAVLHNPGSREASVALFFLEADTDSSAATGKVTAVPAGTSVALDDLVRKTFGAATSGAILVASDEPLLVTSRTYNDAASGTYGQFVPGLPLDEAIGSGEKVRLIQLTRNGHFRTNIGFANLSAAPLHVTVDLFEADGSPIATRTYTVPPWSFHQKTRILTADVEDAHAIVSSDDPDATYFTYASVVDNDSGDPTFVLPVPATGDVLVVPAAAHVKGAEGTNWKTDLEVHNPGSSAVTFTVEALIRGQANPSPPSATFTVEPGHSRRFADVLDAVFHLSGAAALRITPGSGALMATSRTYNDTGSGTYGQLIPARPVAEAAATASGARLLQLAQSSSNTKGYRTNLGLTNATGSTISVNVRLFDGEGHELDLVTQELEPHEFVQIDKIFRQAVSGTVENGYATVASPTPGAAFFAYASVVDNRSGDPVNVPALW